MVTVGDGQYWTRRLLREQVVRLGLRAGDAVMVHAGLRAVEILGRGDRRPGDLCRIVHLVEAVGALQLEMRMLEAELDQVLDLKSMTGPTELHTGDPQQVDQ